MSYIIFIFVCVLLFFLSFTDLFFAGAGGGGLSHVDEFCFDSMLRTFVLAKDTPVSSHVRISIYPYTTMLPTFVQ